MRIHRVLSRSLKPCGTGLQEDARQGSRDVSAINGAREAIFFTVEQCRELSDGPL